MFVAADAGTDFPLQNIIWTLLIFFALALWVWLLITVLTDVFRRDGMSTWERVGWVALAFVLPVLGPLTYLVTRGRDMGTLGMGGSQQRMDAYTRSATGDGQFHGLHDEAADRRAMSGPIRPA